jgi:DNA-directed RNA polymerase sigma subunit (sigma70/sigma32)
MDNSEEPLDSERLRQLRQSMTVEDIAALRRRFDRDPNGLSKDEVAVLYLVTREKIRAFERKAQRKRDKQGNSHEP